MNAELREKVVRIASTIATGGGSVLVPNIAHTESPAKLLAAGDYPIIRSIDEQGRPVEFALIYDGGDPNPIVKEDFPYGYTSTEEAVKASVQSWNGFINTPVIRDYAKRYKLLMRIPSTFVEDTAFDQDGISQNVNAYKREIDRSLYALSKIGQPIPLETTTLIKPLTNGGLTGSTTGSKNLTEPQSIYIRQGITWPDYDSLTPERKKAADKARAHEDGWRWGLKPVTNQADYMKSIMGVGDEWLPDQEAWIRALFASNEGNYPNRFQQRPLEITMGGMSSLTAINPLRMRDTKLTANLVIPDGTTQLKIGIKSGDAAAYTNIFGREFVESLRNNPFAIPPSEVGKFEFARVGGKYDWEVCASGLATPLPYESPGWGDVEIWPGQFIKVPCAHFTEELPLPSPDAFSPVNFGRGEVIDSLNPDLTFTGPKETFYFDVRLSKDPSFNNDPKTAVAPVYQEIIDGGMTKPINTYQVPDKYPLEPGQTYFMSIRPRVPSNVLEAAWGPSWNFRTDSAATVKSRLADFNYGHGVIGASQKDLDKYGAANPNYNRWKYLGPRILQDKSLCPQPVFV